MKRESPEEQRKQMLEAPRPSVRQEPEELPEEYRQLMEQRGDSRERVVCDYIAGMSDSYAIDKFEELFVPKAWKDI